MRPMPNERLELLRQTDLELGAFGHSPAGTANGLFEFWRPTGVLRIIASDDLGWEHVSVSLTTRCPTWDEMCLVKDMFWLPHEAVAQYHPPDSDYVNDHPYCLHLWKPKDVALPLPPTFMIGVGRRNKRRV